MYNWNIDKGNIAMRQMNELNDIMSDFESFSDNELPLSSIANVLLPINHKFVNSDVQNFKSIDYQSTLNIIQDYKLETSLIHNQEQNIENSMSKYECDICGQIFFKRILIIKHFRNSLCFPDKLVSIKNNSSKHNLCNCSKNTKLYINNINKVVTNDIEQMDKCKMCHSVIQNNKCNKLYTKENNLKFESCPMFYNFTQINTHSDKKELRWKCKICDKIFTKLSILKEHRSIHSENKLFDSDKYNKSNINLNSLKNYKTLSNEYTHTCKYNNLNPSVSQHNCKIQNLSQNYECSRCSKVFHKRSEIVNHIFKIHEEYYSKYSCDTCSNLYKSASHELVLHLEKKLFKCDVCFQPFTTAYRLHQHYRWHLGIDSFKCQYCSKIFSKYSVYLLHEKIHTGEKPFRCNFCCKWFSVLSNLNIHLTFGNSFVCNICQQIFSEMSLLLSHSRIHTKDKQLENKCKKKVKYQSSTLKIHSKQFTSKKIYKCNACFKQFTRLSLLNSHSKTHINDFQKCQNSNNFFSKSSSLNQHKNVHVNDEFFKCKLCQEIFSNRNMYITHECISYKCKLCQKKCNTSSILKKHYENVHKNNNIYESPTNINKHKKEHVQPGNSISLTLNMNNEFNKMENMFLNKIYKCDLCKLKMNNPSQILTHILQTHY